MASEVRVNQIQNRSGLGTVTFSDSGVSIAGVTTVGILSATGNSVFSGSVTATTFSGALTGNATGLSGTPNITVGSIIASSATISGNVSVAGTLTYEDVTNVDSVGLVTARTGVRIDAGGLVVVGVTTVAAGSTAAPSITPTGDSNTGIFFPSADTIAFGEGGSEALRIDSSGNIGIGTDNPSSKLNIGGETAQFPSSIQIYSTLHATSRRAAIGLGGTPGNTNPDWLLLQDNSGNGTKDFGIYTGQIPGTPLKIDTSGRVTMPYQPRFNAFGGTYSIGNAIVFNNASVNVGSHYNTSNGRFTVPLTGTYLIYGQFFVSATGTTQINMRVNNSVGYLELKSNTSEGAYNSNSGSFIATLSTGDYVTMFADSGSVLMGRQFTFFGGYLVG